MQQSFQYRQERIREQLGAFGGGMDAVFLNGAGDRVNACIDIRDHGDVVLRGNLRKYLVELLHVVGSVVGRQSDAGQNHLAPGLQQRADNGVQVTARIGDGDAAQPVIAAEFDNHNGRMQSKHVPEAIDAIFGRVAADSGVDDAVMVAAAVELGLQNGGISMPRIDSVSGRNAVAKAVDDGNGSARCSVTIRKQEKCGGKNAAGHSKSIAILCGRSEAAGAFDGLVICEGVAGERMIEVRGLKKSIRNGPRVVEILRGIDLAIPKGQFAAVMGASGSGKSTLLGLLAGLDTPTEGQVILDGVDISGLEEDRLAGIRGTRIGFVFQSYQLIPTLTALENVMLPHELNAPGDARRKAESLLTTVGLQDRLHHYPVQLSGGEQQRVALARAFVLDPPIVLADEPTGNLDTRNGQHVLELLTERQRESGTTLVMVTHDPQIAERADRRIHLRDGAVVADEMRLAGEPVR